jgi:hypothetical protein
MERVGKCDICFSYPKIVDHYKFYVKGSEGIMICHDCRIYLTHIIEKKREENWKNKSKNNNTKEG